MPTSKKPRKLKMLDGGLKPKILNIRQPNIGVDLAKAQEMAMRSIALGLDEAFNGDLRGDQRQVGFLLLVFPFHAAVGDCNYIMNGAKISDMKKFLQHQIELIERKEQEDADVSG